MNLENWNKQTDSSNASQPIDFIRALGTTADLRNLNSKNSLPEEFPSAANFTGFDNNSAVAHGKNNLTEKASPAEAKKHGSDSSPLNYTEKRQTDNATQTNATDAGDKTKLRGTPEEQTNLDASRQRLRIDAAKNIESPKDRDKFMHDMDALEERAKTQPLSAKEVSATYDQLSKLLEAKSGAVPKQERVLAAETLAHHLADPTNIDQGDHNTCNVTTLEERLSTRNPSQTAEIVATMALTGQWVAPDGKHIKITPGSLVPGVEERNNPPLDGQRSYATQLLNLALVNDIEQRKQPPEFYSQERPKGQGDKGERLKYADGRNVATDDVLHNGDKKTPFNSPDLQASDISRLGRSINGEGQFVIANSEFPEPGDLVTIKSPEDLQRVLTTMKNSGKLPAVIKVNANDTAFDGKPDGTFAGHVVSITDFDPTTGRVHVVNQWGQNSKKDMALADLYRATTNYFPLIMPTTD